MNQTIVHIVDDDAAMRDSLAFLLSAEGLASRLYDGAAALLARVGELEPGCVVTDIRMPVMSGMELITQLRQRGVTHPVIVLTGHADVPLAVQAMKAGVADFLEKPFDDVVLLRALRAALAQGQTEVSRLSQHAEISARAALLTKREREVFQAIAGGDSNKTAAIRLGISPRTVEIYRANVMEKMKAQTLSELVRMSLMLKGATP
ncbi:MAG: response regulator FixJ [Terricaulis sp.]